MQMSGGHLRLPVQKLAATLISRKAGNAIESPLSHQNIGCPFWGGRYFRLYVNSWGRDKEQIIASRVGVKAPARFLCTTEEDSVSEIAEVTHSKTDSFQDFGFVVAAFNKAV